ncbi:MAG: energy transducer TonB [Gammaproteobacteria bacterium]|nr:energy transducer TonB [Gammaproteobacteria bacterium]
MSTASMPPIKARDRLSMTLFLAIALHALFILGVSFNIELDPTRDKQALPTMEITLVHSRDETTPDEARFLAQANQQGGGEEEDPSRPGSPIFNPLPIPQQGQDMQSQMEAAPNQRRPEEQTVMSVEQSEHRWRQPKEQSTQQPLERERIANRIQERRLELASISAEIRQLQQVVSQTPREKYISAKTREYKYAAYIDAWRQDVERVGNLNYPDKAKHGRISGDLLLDVAINQDGSLRDVVVLRSSGHKILDDAARRIVNLAAPFDPFSEEVREDFDVLHITYTWRFDSQGQMRTSP